MRMVLSGILHIHQNRIVHRDMKPANVLLDENFQLNIIDFGCASSPGQDGSMNSIVGTPMFIAPEIYKAKIEGHGQNYDKAVDIYACGVMMYYMFSAEYPYGCGDVDDLEQIEEMVCMKALDFKSASF